MINRLVAGFSALLPLSKNMAQSSYYARGESAKTAFGLVEVNGTHATTNV
jgi:hypothetical protein